MLMGSFSSCMDQTKQAVHQVLDERIGDVSQLIVRLNSCLRRY